MKKTFLSLGGLAALAMAACTAVPQTLPPGQYKETERNVNAQGTEYKKETTTDVYYDEYGNKRATQKTETSRDPKGLFNKDTSTSVRSY